MNSHTMERWALAQKSYSVGHWVEAIEACAEVVAEEPFFAGAQWMMSRSYQAIGEFRKAVAHARQSARCLSSESTVEERLLVSRGLISAGEYRVAIDVIATIAIADPGAAGAANRVAEQLMMLDMPAESLEWIAVARRRGAEGSALAYVQGNAFKFLGDFHAAAEAYEDAIRIDAGDGFAHLALATLALPGGSGTRIDRLRRTMQSVKVERSLAAMKFALFRELDNVGDTELAWKALEDGLRIKHAGVSYNINQDDAIFDQMIKNIDGQPVQLEKQTANFRPIFILGMPRTGTTLVERILGNHSAVEAGGELSELRMAYKWCTDYYCPAFLDLYAAKKSFDIEMLGKLYLHSVGWRARGKQCLTDKHPGNTILAGFILKTLPTAKVILMQRNAIETCFGNLKELFAEGYYEYSYSQIDVANHYRNQARLARHMLEHGEGRVMAVNYEDLVRKPAVEIKRILLHCGLEEEAKVEDVTKNATFVSTASSVQVRQPIHVGRLEASKPYYSQLARLRSALENDRR